MPTPRTTLDDRSTPIAWLFGLAVAVMLALATYTLIVGVSVT